MNVDFYTEEDSARFISVVGDAVICMLYCPNVYTGVALKKISERSDL